MEKTTFTTKKQLFILSSLLIVLSFVFYGNTLNNGFSMDDELVTSTDKQEHAIVSQGIAGIQTIFKSRYANHHQQSYSYRPITTLSFAIEYDLFKDASDRAKISHFISILLYGLSCCVLLLFLQTLFKNNFLFFSFIAVLLFMIHPIHSEVVNNIKSRDEMLAFIFGLSMIICFLRFYDTRKIGYSIATLFFLFLAIFSKETGAIFIALAPVCLYFFRSVNIKKLVFFVAAIGVAYLILDMGTKTMIDAPKVRNFEFLENPLYTMNFHHRIPMFFYSIAYYIYLFIKPFPLVYYYGYDEVSIINYTSWKFYVSLALVTTLLFFMLKGLKEKKHVSFYLLFFFLAIGGAANLIFPLPGIIAERFAFIASVPFCLLLTLGAFKLTKSTLSTSYQFSQLKVFTLSTVVLAGIALGFTRERNKDWDSAFSIYKADIKKVPNSVKANLMLATEYTDKAKRLQAAGNLDEYPSVMALADSAIKYFQSARSIYPEGENAYNNLGYIALNFQHNTFKGINYLEKGVKLKPTVPEAQFNLGKSYGTLYTYYDDLIYYLANDSLGMEQPQNIDTAVITFITESKDVERFFNDWQRYQFIAAVYEKVWSPSMNPVMGNIYINFLKHQLAQSDLGYEKRMKRLTVIAKKSLQEQYDLLGRELQLMHEELVNTGRETFNSQGSSHLAVLAMAKHYYKNQFYKQFLQLHEIAPNYFEQYPTVTRFALETNDHQQAIDWGHRFLSTEPPSPEQAYMQIGFSFDALNQPDSVNFYFQKSISEKQLIINKLLEAPKSKQEIGTINQLRQDIERMNTTLMQHNVN